MTTTRKETDSLAVVDVPADKPSGVLRLNVPHNCQFFCSASSGRLAPLGDLEDVAGGRQVKRRVELASDRTGVVVQHLDERCGSGRYRDARLPHLIDRSYS